MANVNITAAAAQAGVERYAYVSAATFRLMESLFPDSRVSSEPPRLNLSRDAAPSLPPPPCRGGPGPPRGGLPVPTGETSGGMMSGGAAAGLPAAARGARGMAAEPLPAPAASGAAAEAAAATAATATAAAARWRRCVRRQYGSQKCRLSLMPYHWLQVLKLAQPKR